MNLVGIIKQVGNIISHIQLAQADFFSCAKFMLFLYQQIQYIPFTFKANKHNIKKCIIVWFFFRASTCRTDILFKDFKTTISLYLFEPARSEKQKCQLRWQLEVYTNWILIWYFIEGKNTTLPYSKMKSLKSIICVSNGHFQWRCVFCSLKNISNKQWVSSYSLGVISHVWYKIRLISETNKNFLRQCPFDTFNLLPLYPWKVRR